MGQRPSPWEGRVFAGDARRVLKHLPGRAFDLVLTSPPYWPSGPRERRGEIGVEKRSARYATALQAVGREVQRLLKPGGWFVPVLGGRSAGSAAAALRAVGFSALPPTLWLQANTRGPSVELVLFLSRGRGRCRDSCEVPHGGTWPLERPRPREGYEVLPREMVEAVIEAHCPPGGAVLDPFLGWGTVAEAAQRLGRKWCGVELDPEVQERTMKRLGGAAEA